MRALARYAVANAVMRATMPRYLSRQELDAMATAPSPSAAWEALGKTGFGDWIPAYENQDALTIEALLHKATALRFMKVARALKGRPAAVARVLLSRWDLDVLLNALRLWHGGKGEGEPPIHPATFVDSLPFAAMVRAETLDELAITLDKTPYGSVLKSCRKSYEANGSLLPIETALERDHHKRLLAAVHALGGHDAQNAVSLLAVQIDVLNLAAASRLLAQRQIPLDALPGHLIAGPGSISRHLMRHGLVMESITHYQDHALGTLAESDTGSLPPLRRITLLERLLYEEMERRARRALAGFPFGIITTLAFHLLSRLELRNLRVLFAAKAIGLDETTTRSRLYGMR